MKKCTVSTLAAMFLFTLSSNLLAQSELAQSSGVPYKTPNSVLYGSDVIIDDNPTQDQRHVNLSVTFNGRLYACYSVNQGGFRGWRIMTSWDDGVTWDQLSSISLSSDWYVKDMDIVVTGFNDKELRVFVARVLQNDVASESNLKVTEYSPFSGTLVGTLIDDVVSSGELYHDVALAGDYQFPAYLSSPNSLAVLYSKTVAARDSIVLLTSSDGGTTLDGRQTITTTFSYTRNVSLAYGRGHSYFNGRYYAAWEQRSSPSTDVGRIYTAHSDPYFNSTFTTPVRLDNMIGSTADFARNPSISCQFGDADNDLLNFSEVVLFDRAFGGNLSEFDVVGCYNKEAANTDNWFIFGMAATGDMEIQPEINFDPGYNNFLATYFNLTEQKLPYVVKNMNLADPYSWLVLIDGYNSATNLLNPYPKVEINPAYLQVAHVWNGEGPGGGQAMFDAEYSHVGIKDAAPPDVAVSVSPNPASTLATFRVDLAGEAYPTIRIFSLQGTGLMQIDGGNCTAGVRSFTIDISALPDGCYIYRVTAGDRARTGRLIVKK